jgi:hypothetical protein
MQTIPYNVCTAQGITAEGERLNTADLLFKVSCFVKKVINIYKKELI